MLVLGSNLELPEGNAEVVPAAKMVEEVERHEREQSQLLTDAFARVRELVAGGRALVERGVYEAMRRSAEQGAGAVGGVLMEISCGIGLDASVIYDQTWHVLGNAGSCADARICISCPVRAGRSPPDQRRSLPSTETAP